MPQWRLKQDMTQVLGEDIDGLLLRPCSRCCQSLVLHGGSEKPAVSVLCRQPHLPGGRAFSLQE